MAGSDERRRALAMLREVEQRFEAGADVTADLADLLRTVRAVMESSLRGEDELRERCDRLLAHQTLLDERLLRVENNRLFRAWNAISVKGLQFYNRAGQKLRKWPFQLLLPRPQPSTSEYHRWVNHQEAALPSLSEHRTIAANWPARPLISVIMPLSRPDERWFAEAVASVRAQSYESWQLCLAASGPQAASVLALIEQNVSRDPRIQFKSLAETEGISAAWNAASELAEGEYFGFLDQNDVLSPFALHYVVEWLQDAGPDLIYSDEDHLGPASMRVQPIFKPDWSPSLLLPGTYPGRFLVARREAFDSVGGFRTQFEGAQDHDLALRITARYPKVRHISRVLYHARTGKASAVEPDARDARFPMPEGSAVSIIICSKTARLVERCVRSLRNHIRGLACEVLVVHHEDGEPDHEMRRVLTHMGVKTVPYRGAFHFSKMNNMAAAAANAPYLLFLNDDIYAAAGGWCERLLGRLQEPGVGIAGALLRYPGGAIQHAGIVLGMGDGAGHVGRFRFASELWPWLTMTREVSAVTAACMAIRADIFHQLGGFDPGFPNNYNDVDLCLRAASAGYRAVCVAVDGLIHDECGTRRGLTHLAEREAFYQRWMEVLRRPDPYYSAALRPTEEIALNGLDSVASPPTSPWRPQSHLPPERF